MGADETEGAPGAVPWPRENPYATGAPIFKSDSFVDRREELRRLHLAVGNPDLRHIVLTGRRRIGKSSVLKRLVVELAGELPSAAVDRVQPSVAVLEDLRNLELEPGESPAALASTVLADLAGSLARQLQLDALPTWGDPVGFRRVVLPCLARAAAERRVVVILDEMEFLDERDDRAAELVFSAFAGESTARDWKGTAGPPILVASWGRPLGEVRDVRGRLRFLRYSEDFEIDCFDDRAVEELCGLSRAYAWEGRAREALVEVTGGHPLYACGIGHVLFERRRREGNVAPVTAKEVEEAVGEAIARVESSLLWAWDQLGLVQSLLGRALAELTSEAAAGRTLEGGFTLDEVRGRLRDRGREVDRDRLKAALPGLVNNGVVADVDRGREGVDTARYRISSRFLTDWLCARSYDQLTRRQFKDHLDKAHRLIALGSRQAAMGEFLEARQKVEVSLPQDDLAALAGLLAEFGREEEGLKVYREAWGRGPSEAIKVPYFDLLLRRLQRLFAAGDVPRPYHAEWQGENPRDLWEELRLVDRQRAAEPRAAGFVTVTLLDRWSDHLGRHEPVEAQASFAALAELSPEGWRKEAADRYAAVLGELEVERPGHEGRLATALAAVRDAFPVLTAGRIEFDAAPSVAALDAELEDYRRDVGDDPAQLERYRRHLLRKRTPACWSETTAVLRTAWGAPHRDDLPRLPASLLDTLVTRAPDACRRELVDLVTRHAIDRLQPLLHEAPAEAFTLVQLVHDWLELVDPSQALVGLQAQLNEHVLGVVVDGDDLEVRRFLAHGAAIYGKLLAAGARAKVELPLPEILDLIRELTRRAVEVPAPLRDAADARLWRNLLAEPPLADLDGAGALAEKWLALSDHGGAPPVGAAPLGGIQPEDPLDALFDELKIQRGAEIPLEKTAVPVEHLRVFRGRLKTTGEDVNVKVYSLPEVGEAGPTEMERILLMMWAKERRLLDDLASRRRARGLTAFRDSRSVELKTGAADAGGTTRRWLVVITEAAGPNNLRTEIGRRLSGLRRPGRQEVWSHVYWLIEAVHLLHRASYLHRAIRPENVLIAPGDEVSELKLANYEWSIYLQALGEWQAKRRWHLDRYTAPEVLEQWKLAGESPYGESFAADIYALGLILFEILVRPLRSELGEYHAPTDYSHDEHVAWLDQIRREAAAGLSSVDERLLLTEMLEPDPRHRMTDLSRAVEVAWRLSLGGSLVQQQLVDPRHVPTLVTLLWRGSDNSVAVFLEQAGIDLSEVGPEIPDLARFVEGELAGARVYRNGSPDDYPLLLEGRRVTFAACPFREERTGQVYRRIAFCVVARLQDWKTGPPLARLPGTVKVIDLRDMRNAILEPARGPGVSYNQAWEVLFQLARRSEGGLLPAQRQMLSLLELTAEVERKLWDTSVLPFRKIKSGDDGRGEWVWIEDRVWAPDQPGLARFLSQQMARESIEFELSTKPHATAPFNPGSLWTVGMIDPIGRRVQLTRPWGASNDPPPDDGYLRPRTLEGNRALFHRRRRLLGRLEDDAFLIRAITDPDKLISGTGLQAGDIAYFNEGLDRDKQEVVDAVLRSRPIHVVQGPPGTGKTTLATEVIRQVLRRRRQEHTDARILVTSQSHSPLNNLLERVAREIEEAENREAAAAARAAAEKAGVGRRAQRRAATRAGGGQTVIVRLGSEERILRGFGRKPARPTAGGDGKPAGDGRRGPAGPGQDASDLDASGQAVRRYIPELVAARHLGEAARWEPGPGDGFGLELLAEWRQFLRGKSGDDIDGLRADLERRLARTANIVFVTANDRQIHELNDDDYFDFLIFEEAAKAFPLEVLAPMSHARQWLLIGDHNQLPPFNFEAFRDQLLNCLTGPAGLLSHGNALSRARLARLHLSDGVAELAMRIVNFFEYLFDISGAGIRPFAFPLRTQWRMHPDIGDLIEEVYYKGILRNGDPALLRSTRSHNLIAPVRIKEMTSGLNQRELAVSKNNLIWIDTPLAVTRAQEWGERPAVGGGYRNPYEAQVIYAYLLDVKTKRPFGLHSVMLLSPYLAQVQLLNDFFVNWTAEAHPETGDLRDKAVTVDSAQGRQARVVFVSLVRNNPEDPLVDETAAFGFLTNLQRSVVMFSRAESLMVIVGCSKHFRKRPDLHIARVFEFVEGHGAVIDAKDVIKPYQLDKLREHESVRRMHINEDRSRARSQIDG